MNEAGFSNDVIDQLTHSKANRLNLFDSIDKRLQGFVLTKLKPKIQREILSTLEIADIVEILNPLDPDKATNILRQVDEKSAKEIVEKLNKNIKTKTEFLLKFSPSTAAGMMNLDYILVDKDSTRDQLVKDIKVHEKRTGKFPAIFIVDEGKLMGEIPGHDLILYEEGESLSKYFKKFTSIKYDSDERKVIDSFSKHPHNKIVVIDHDKSVIGIIHSDDIISVINKNSSSGLYNFAGVHREEDALDSAWTKVKFRYYWLIINLATAFLAASVVSMFEDTISKFVLLAIYMPIVAGMGGNAGTQTMAVAVRGLVLKEIELKTGGKFIVNEVIAGAINGVINGIIVAVIATLWGGNAELGLVLGIAMVINLVIAGFFGALIPMVMKALGRDPASSATIFITTATDVLGFLVFLSLAKLIL
jgi:magnesium transporter